MLVLFVVILGVFMTGREQSVEACGGPPEADMFAMMVVMQKQFEPGSSGGMCSPDIPSGYVVFARDEDNQIWAISSKLLYGGTQIGDEFNIAWQSTGTPGGYVVKGNTRRHEIEAFQIASWSLKTRKE